MIESPLRGDYTRNKRYAKACMRDSLARGEAPFAMHLLYAQEGILDDTKPEERTMGIDSGLAWLLVGQQVALYIDLGVTEGMQIAEERANKWNIPLVRREIPGWERENYETELAE